MKKPILSIVAQSLAWGWFQMISIYLINRFFGTPYEFLYTIFFLSGFIFLTTITGFWNNDESE